MQSRLFATHKHTVTLAYRILIQWFDIQLFQLQSFSEDRPSLVCLQLQPSFWKQCVITYLNNTDDRLGLCTVASGGYIHKHRVMI